MWGAWTQVNGLILNIIFSCATWPRQAIEGVGILRPCVFSDNYHCTRSHDNPAPSLGNAFSVTKCHIYEPIRNWDIVRWEVPGLTASNRLMSSRSFLTSQSVELPSGSDDRTFSLAIVKHDEHLWPGSKHSMCGSRFDEYMCTPYSKFCGGKRWGWICLSGTNLAHPFSHILRDLLDRAALNCTFRCLSVLSWFSYWFFSRPHLCIDKEVRIPYMSDAQKSPRLATRTSLFSQRIPSILSVLRDPLERVQRCTTPKNTCKLSNVDVVEVHMSISAMGVPFLYVLSQSLSSTSKRMYI
jgi:hypothetical protein